MTNEQVIWNKLINSGMTKAGASGMMGNLYTESALNPKNLQNSYEKSLGYSDEGYTKAVDSGTYSGFVHDSAGYGLAQWTYHARKQALLNFAKSRNVSIGDMGMQLDFLIKELKEDYPSVWSCLCSTSSVRTASDTVMTQFERPADISDSAKNKRYEFSKKYYDMFATSTNKAPTAELIQEILSGKWGNGDERKTRLIEAGYDYNDVQEMVNKTLTGSAGEGYVVSPSHGVKVTLTFDDHTYSGLLEED